MGTTTSLASRDRFITEAARLFAVQGYATTTVADIQVACGLTAGSGALYKHFSSKRELLEAVVGVHIATMREGNRSFHDEASDDLDGTLRFLVHAMWSSMERDHQALRVTLRDLDDFPEVREQMWAEIRRNVYDEFTHWLSRQADRGTIRLADPQATAAVLLASLTYYPILDILIGHPPGDVPANRFSDAWVRHALAALTHDTAGRPEPGPVDAGRPIVSTVATTWRDSTGAVEAEPQQLRRS